MSLTNTFEPVGDALLHCNPLSTLEQAISELLSEEPDWALFTFLILRSFSLFLLHKALHMATLRLVLLLHPGLVLLLVPIADIVIALIMVFFAILVITSL